MGLDNRDYLRDESIRYGGGGYSGGTSFGSHAPMCKRLLIITIVAYVLQMLLTRNWTNEELGAWRERAVSRVEVQAEELGLSPEEIAAEAEKVRSTPLKPSALGLPKQVSIVQDWCQLDTTKLFKGQVWRLVTCAFCHDRFSPFHILFNMLFFWWFGPRLEGMYGSKEFLLFYLTSAVVASLSFVALDLVSGDPVPMIGASGAVMAVTMLFALHFPHQVIYLFFIIPVEVKWMVLLYAIMDLHPVLQVLAGDGALNDSVAHAAHLGGLAFGYYYGRKQTRLYPYWSGLTTWWKARKKGFKVVRSGPSATPRSQKLEDDMDRILKKISEQGEASLTNAERETLKRASRQLRDRRR